MQLGFIGLGKMGLPMVLRLQKGGHHVVVIDHHQENIDKAVAAGADSAKDEHELVTKLGDPMIVWLMIQSKYVDAQLDVLLPLLPKGSIIVDGGNSDYRLTKERAKKVTGAGMAMVDVGTSGGVLGAENGYCMMVGGDEQAAKTIEPLIVAMAQEGGHQYFGPSGAGHFVKMVHNAIEYGIMESYAEGYRIIKETDYPALDLGALGNVWQHGSIITSSLNELCAQELTRNPELAGIDGYVAENGEARWSLEVAREKQIEAPAIQASLDVRVASQNGKVSFATKLLAAMRNGFGGHPLNTEG
jgi:6-phosphogluconate dehydrogenase